MDQEKMIYFTEEDGNRTGFYVLEETKINGKNYLLVTDSEDDEEADAYIMLEISSEENGETVYEMVEDEEELAYLGKIFEQLLEDVEVIS